MALASCAFRMVGVVTDGMTRFVAEEQLQGGLLGEDGDLDGVEPAQLAVTRGEEDAAGEMSRDSFGPDRASELSGILEVVEDEQGVWSAVEFLERDLKLAVGRLGRDSRDAAWPPIWANP